MSKGVLKEHTDTLVLMFCGLRRKPPTVASITKAFKNALGPEDPQEHSSLTQRRMQWARDETQKLHMVWRYVRDSLSRSATSRDLALDSIKSCFRNVVNKRPAGGSEDESDEPVEADGSQCVGIDGSEDEPDEREYVDALRKALGLDHSEEEEEETLPEEPQAEVAPAPSPMKCLSSREAEVASQPDRVAASPPQRRRLSEKASCVSVDSSDANPTPGGGPESPLGRTSTVSFAVSPPASGVRMTPAAAGATRARFWTPAMKKQKKKTSFCRDEETQEEDQELDQEGDQEAEEEDREEDQEQLWF